VVGVGEQAELEAFLATNSALVSGESNETPRISMPLSLNAAKLSRSVHPSVVQPEVIAFG
jgi:hypothetical protein